MEPARALIGTVFRGELLHLAAAISHVCRRDGHEVKLNVNALVSGQMREDSRYLPTGREATEGDALGINVQRGGIVDCLDVVSVRSAECDVLLLPILLFPSSRIWLWGSGTRVPCDNQRL